MSVKNLHRSIWLLLAVGILGLAFLTGCGSKENAAEKAPAGSPPAAKSEAAPKSQEVDELAFYKDKTVTLIVSTKPGGGYDAYGRLVAPILQKYLPGSTIIVKNVPGAGHIIGANEIYNSTPDGLTFGIFNKGLITAQLSNSEGIKFDLKKMNFLANAAREPRVFAISTKTKYQNIDDLKKAAKPILMATAGVGSAAYTDSVMLGKIFGLNVKVVPGYEGQAADLAIMRGEVDGQVQSFDSSRPLLENKETRPILIIGTRKLPGLESTPLIGDIAPKEFKSLANLMSTQAEISRPYAAPPGLPEGRLKALREAFDKAFKDPDLLKSAETGQLPIDYMNGEETQKAFLDALNQPPEVMDLVKELFKEQS